MYDLEVEDNHNYLITEEDILVHNGNCPAIAKQILQAARSGKVGDIINLVLKGYPNSRVVNKKINKAIREAAKNGKVFDPFVDWVSHKGAKYRRALKEIKVGGRKVVIEYLDIDFGNNIVKGATVKFAELSSEYGKHFSEAGNELLKRLKKAGTKDELVKELGKNARRVGTTIVSSTGKVYTWHHNLAKGQLELVEQLAHQTAKHMGAGSVMRFIKDMFK